MPVFGLAHLLGINLMPRIRNWKDLKLFRPTKEACYTHIDELFSDSINWDVIETHLPDMLRVVLSIKAGRITASTLLRKLGTYSRKNKLYVAMRELGRVVRTVFLLKYLSDPTLRRTIQGATNKSEAFNKFIQWVSFGGGGLIAELYPVLHLGLVVDHLSKFVVREAEIKIRRRIIGIQANRFLIDRHGFTVLTILSEHSADQQRIGCGLLRR